MSLQYIVSQTTAMFPGKLNIFFTLIFGFKIVLAQTPVPGGVVNGTWTLAGSPYLVQGSIQVVNGDSLIIQPGVTVIFQDAYKFLILGKLKAVGTVTDSITFMAADTAKGWKGIRFDNTPVSNDTSRIAYCIIKYGKANGTMPDDRGGALYFNNFSKAVISNCRISDCFAIYGGGGIWCVADPIIKNNTIRNNKSNGLGGGILCAGSGTNSLQNNLISGNVANQGGGVFWENYGNNSVISNNTITGNLASPGGGIYCSGGNPLIVKNTITSNKSSSAGGIFVHEQSNPIITDNIVSNNLGGGIYSFSYYAPSITYNTVTGNKGHGIKCQSGGNNSHTIGNNTISNNISNEGAAIHSTTSQNGTAFIFNNTINQNTGGGIYFNGNNIKIFNNNISNNRADTVGLNHGGGICGGGGDTSTAIFNNSIAYNSAGAGGGGIYMLGIVGVYNNSITNNEASQGAGVHFHYSDAVFINNIISNNTALEGKGGALYFHFSSPVLINNTISNNEATDTSGRGGALYFNYNSSPVFRNCILYGNIASKGNTVFISDEASDPDFLYCDVEGGPGSFALNNNFYTGVYQNTINSNPVFMNPSPGSGSGYNGLAADWSLQSNSPCIDSGDPTGGTYPATDKAGKPRISGIAIDMGAYEFQHANSISRLFSEQNIQVFPVPAHERITIQLPERIFEIAILNALGEEMLLPSHRSDYQATVDVSKLSDGVYFLRMQFPNKIVIKKIIVHKG